MSRTIYLVLLAVCIAFVWFTGQQLPSSVASHFGASGAPNSFMPRESYLGFFIAIMVVVPSLIALTGQLARRLPVSLVNLPNRAYWLAPERKESTLDALSSLSTWFACFLLVFLSLVHWLVVRANLSPDHQLDARLLVVGLTLLLVTFAVWMVVVLRRFARIP